MICHNRVTFFQDYILCQYWKNMHPVWRLLFIYLFLWNSPLINVFSRSEKTFIRGKELIWHCHYSKCICVNIMFVLNWQWLFSNMVSIYTRAPNYWKDNSSNILRPQISLTTYTVFRRTFNMYTHTYSIYNI